MTAPIIVDRGRTVTLAVTWSAGDDVSGSTFVSQIRETVASSSTLIATWSIDTTNAATGALVLTLDDAVTAAITQEYGYMDLKQTTGGEPTSAFNGPLVVKFVGVPTA